jgi:hypothetical protein
MFFFAICGEKPLVGFEKEIKTRKCLISGINQGFSGPFWLRHARLLNFGVNLLRLIGCDLHGE